MEHSVNVDLEIVNTPDGEPNCRAHLEAGPHYDITIHRAGCPHHGSPRADRERRYWRDFATEDDAQQFANNTAAQPLVSVAYPVMVRVCQA